MTSMPRSAHGASTQLSATSMWQGKRLCVRGLKLHRNYRRGGVITPQRRLIDTIV